MLIDGEKWACEACVRGHRVSSCRHHDRPLIRINKKGRPFSVCRLCRGPCTDREEHSKLNSHDKKSDGESDAKSSGKVFRTATRKQLHGVEPSLPPSHALHHSLHLTRPPPSKVTILILIPLIPLISVILRSLFLHPPPAFFRRVFQRPLRLLVVLIRYHSGHIPCRVRSSRIPR